MHGQSNPPQSLHLQLSLSPQLESATRTENAIQTNTTPRPNSGIFTHDSITPGPAPWTPESVISTLPHALQPPPTNPQSTPLPFFHLLQRLKTTKREGWRRFGIDRGESIADHMYRMGIITMLAPAAVAAKVDVARCTKMALVHDMAEALVGDITPVDGVLKSEKSRRELATIRYLCRGLLGGVGQGVEEAGRAIEEVWQEYEDGETLESKFVHDVDKLELMLQMVEYEKMAEGRNDLGEFSHVARRIELPEVREWAELVLKEREEYWVAVKGSLPRGTVSDETKQKQDAYYANGHAR